jgi:hypothetical protein
MDSPDPRVTAVRTNSLIGSGTCSIVDECFTNAELIDELDEYQVNTPEAAVEHFILSEDLSKENALNYREGTDEDPELEAYDQWEKSLKAYRSANPEN